MRAAFCGNRCGAVRERARSDPGNDDAGDDDGDAEGLAGGDLLLEDEGAHDKDPDEAGRGDAGHDGEGNVAQGDLVDGQGQEEEAVGRDDADVEEFAEKAFIAGRVGLGLEQDLAEGGDKGAGDGGRVADLRGEDRGHGCESPLCEDIIWQKYYLAEAVWEREECF